MRLGIGIKICSIRTGLAYLGNKPQLSTGPYLIQLQLIQKQTYGLQEFK